MEDLKIKAKSTDYPGLYITYGTVSAPVSVTSSPNISTGDPVKITIQEETTGGSLKWSHTFTLTEPVFMPEIEVQMLDVNGKLVGKGTLSNW